MSEAVKKGKEYLKGWMPWRLQRYYTYIVITVISLGLPWIRINENHFFLLSFHNLDLHLAFVKFDMQELYLMPFILMLLFIGVFGITVLGGRVFCGWMCPQTIFRVIYRDLIETKLLKMRKRIANKQIEPDYSKAENKVKRVIAIAIWIVLSFIATANLFWFFVPPEDFFGYLMDPAEHTIMIGALLATMAFLLWDVVFIQENFCVYACPYSRIQSVLYDDDTVMAVYDFHRGGHIYDENKEKLYTQEKELLSVEPNAECTTCESCVTVCPTHIDIRKGLQLECINCLECVDACTKVMGNLGKPSLVQWSSDREIVHREGKTQFFRPKILGYIAVLGIVTVLLALMGSDKERMLLNVNKENRLYSTERVDENTVRVENSYIFLFQNTESEAHSYYFDVTGPEGIEDKIKIDRPSKPFKLSPGVKKKKIVVLYTEDVLVENERKDTVLPITITAYAVDDRNITVNRQSRFTFPRYDVLTQQ